MKKTEEIKKWLKRCAALQCGSVGGGECAYECGSAKCIGDLETDALAYIEQLESKLNQAVEDIRMLGRTGEFICPVCAHYNHGEGTKGECVKCLTGDGFRWRGTNNNEG